jgi:nucleotide-binding universal stress UspA family protein
MHAGRPAGGLLDGEISAAEGSGTVSGVRRVIAGVSGSPGSLHALRYAAGLARLHDAGLVSVLAWTPPGGELADRRQPSATLRKLWADSARQRLDSAVGLALGGAPPDLHFDARAVRGEAGPSLVNIACVPGDLLVVGAGRRGSWPGAC